MNNSEKREFVKNIFDYAKGKLKNLFFEIVESHLGYSSEGKYIMTTKIGLKF